jgi:hypothetical protein
MNRKGIIHNDIKLLCGRDNTHLSIADFGLFNKPWFGIPYLMAPKFSKKLKLSVCSRPQACNLKESMECSHIILKGNHAWGWDVFSRSVFSSSDCKYNSHVVRNLWRTFTFEGQMDILKHGNEHLTSAVFHCLQTEPQQELVNIVERMKPWTYKETH